MFNNNLDRLFETFIFIKKSEGREPSTISQYKYSYNSFTNFLDLRGIERKFDSLNRNVFREFITYMREEEVRFEDHPHKGGDPDDVGLTPATINTRLKTLRNMFNTLQSEGIIDSDPIAGIRNVPNPTEEIEILSVKELERLLKAPTKETYAGFRDFVILHVLIDTMMRIGEALQLKDTYFNFEKSSVSVKASIAKGNKPRILPIRPLTGRLIQKLIELNKTFYSEHVFLTNYGEPMTRDHFRKRLSRHAKKAGIKKRVYPHLLRHTAATLFLEDGGDIRHLQSILGHSDIRMVIRYTHLTNKALQKHHAKHSVINRASNKLSRPRITKIDLSDL